MAEGTEERWPEGWPTKLYDLPGGAQTNFPPGTRGYAQEQAFCLLVEANASLGYGRMIQMIHRIWNTQDAGRVDLLDAAAPEAPDG